MPLLRKHGPQAIRLRGERELRALFHEHIPGGRHVHEQPRRQVQGVRDGIQSVHRVWLLARPQWRWRARHRAVAAVRQRGSMAGCLGHGHDRRFGLAGGSSTLAGGWLRCGPSNSLLVEPGRQQRAVHVGANRRAVRAATPRAQCGPRLVRCCRTCRRKHFRRQSTPRRCSGAGTNKTCACCVQIREPPTKGLLASIALHGTR